MAYAAGQKLRASDLSFASAFMYAANPVNGWPANSWWHQPLNAESLDTHGGHIAGGAITGSDTNTGTSLSNRYTVQAGQAGTYRVGGGVYISGAGANSTANARMTKNGNIFPGCGGQSIVLPAGAGAIVTGDKLIELAVGDYVSMQAIVTTNWNTVADQAASGFTTWMAVQRVS